MHRLHQGFKLAALLLVFSCSAPNNSEAPADKTFNLGDTIVTSNAACDRAFSCIVDKRPEYQEMLDTINLFEGEARVEACNNALINPLEVVPECAP